EQRGLGAFDRGEALFGGAQRRVADPLVVRAAGALVLLGIERIETGEGEGRRVDDRRAGGARLRRVAAMDGAGANAARGAAARLLLAHWGLRASALANNAPPRIDCATEALSCQPRLSPWTPRGCAASSSSGRDSS